MTELGMSRWLHACLISSAALGIHTPFQATDSKYESKVKVTQDSRL